MPLVLPSIRIPERFRGPETSANGGWACGSLGQLIEGPTRVRLHAPPALNVDLAVVRCEGALELRHDTRLVATASASPLANSAREAVSWAHAVDATEHFVWKDEHPSPTCFVCGPKAGPSGLNLYPGAVAGRRVAAAPFVIPVDLCEDGIARPELVWALLDCPSYFGLASFEDAPTSVLLGQLTASVRQLPVAGQRCVVGGWALGQEGRKFRCRSALWTEAGELLGEAEAIWIVPKPQD